MWLLLNASDVEMSVQAIFRYEPSKVAVGLAKKLQQLDLYEVPSFAMLPESAGQTAKHSELSKQSAAQPVNQSESAGQSTMLSNDLDWNWIECLSAAELADKLEQSKYIITV